MAEGGEGSGAAGSLEDELNCGICFNVYREPMSLICGHSFCRQCLEELRASQSPRKCPTCRADLGSTPLKLQKNFALASIVEAFRATAPKGQEARRESLQQEEGAGKEQTGAVRCDHCLDRPQPAVKTCLVCEASLCRAHLDKHNAKSLHQEHVLVDVVAVEEKTCRDHGKLLECYCLDEEKGICVLCSKSAAHKGHRVITMKESRDLHQAKISDIMTELQEHKGYLVTFREKIQESENEFKINTKRLTSQLEELFKNIKTELDEKRSRILTSVQSYEKVNLTRIANVKKNLEHKRDQVEQNRQALQKIKEQPDLFLFFKALKPVTDRIANLDLGAELVIVDEVQLDQEMLTQYETQKRNLMLQLDTLLKDVSDHIQCPIGEVSVRGKVCEGGTKYFLA